MKFEIPEDATSKALKEYSNFIENSLRELIEKHRNEKLDIKNIEQLREIMTKYELQLQYDLFQEIFTLLFLREDGEKEIIGRFAIETENLFNKKGK